jgi:hypothetical protein
MITSKIMTAFVLLMVSGASALSQTITSSETPKCIGKRATICGIITSEFEAQQKLQKDAVKFVYLDNNESFSVLTRFSDKDRVGNLPVNGHLCVKGLVEAYHSEELIVFEPCPKVGVCTYHKWLSPTGTQLVLQYAAD